MRLKLWAAAEWCRWYIWHTLIWHRQWATNNWLLQSYFWLENGQFLLCNWWWIKWFWCKILHGKLSAVHLGRVDFSETWWRCARWKTTLLRCARWESTLWRSARWESTLLRRWLIKIGWRWRIRALILMRIHRWCLCWRWQISICLRWWVTAQWDFRWCKHFYSRMEKCGMNQLKSLNRSNKVVHKIAPISCIDREWS